MRLEQLTAKIMVYLLQSYIICDTKHHQCICIASQHCQLVLWSLSEIQLHIDFVSWQVHFPVTRWSSRKM